MGTVTIRPSSESYGGASLTKVGGDGTVTGILSDNLDTSYVTYAAGQETIFEMNMGNPVIPALAQVRLVTPKVRAKVQVASMYLDISLRSVSPYWGYLNVLPTTTIATYSTSGRATANSDGTKLWTQSNLDAIRLNVWFNQSVSGSGGQIYIYELYADVLYNEVTVVSNVGPTGTITDTTRPTVTWTNTDPENDAQERYQIKVFSAAQYGAVGFDPETSASTWSSGEVFSSQASGVVGKDLANNTTYRAYVKSADAGSNGRYSLWVFSTFTVTLNSPAAPTVTATADAPNYRNALVLSTTDNLLTKNQADIETDTTGWASLNNATVTRSTAQAASGVASLSMAPVVAGNMAVTTPAGLSGVPVAGSTQYTALASLRAATTGRTTTIEMQWYDSAGNFLSINTATGTDVTTGFTQVAVTATSHASAAFARIVLRVDGGAVGEVHYVDKMSLAPGNSTTWIRGGLVPSQLVTVERSSNNGTTWTTMKRLTPTTSTVNTQTGEVNLLDTTQRDTLYDNEAPVGVAVIYRARTVATDVGSIAGDYSANSSAATITLSAAQVNTWDLIDPYDSSRTIRGLDVTKFGQQSDQDQATYEALDRPEYIVVSGVIRTEKLGMTLEFLTRAAYNAFETIRSGKRTLLLRRNWTSDQWYITLGPARVLDLSNNFPPIYEVKISATEVASP